MMTDPIADLLTRIRNGLRNRARRVECPASRLKVDVVEILKREGYLAGYEVIPGEGPKATLRVLLRYGPEGELLINRIRRESKPGCRVYVGVEEIPRPMKGMGICILSTPKGVLSDRQARKEQVGGELLCTVW